MNKLLQKRPKYISVDFDGTLFETDYPKVLRPIPEVLDFCTRAQKCGSIIILNTLRKDDHLDMAVAACGDWGLVPDYVNENPPELIEKWEDSRKIFGDIYIDDRNVSIMDVKELLYEGDEIFGVTECAKRVPFKYSGNVLAFIFYCYFFVDRILFHNF